jgi:predicted metal-binding protein
MPDKVHIRADLEQLVQAALDLGASDAKAIASARIRVEERLAALCLNPRCENYGLAPSCPPHVSGPSGFRALQETHPHAIVVRLVVPSSILLSCERREVGRFLHELVAGVEQEAVRLGYADSRGFAGGSCKEIFCSAERDCPALEQEGACRYPEYARPSMSGFGIDVFDLVQTCGWPAQHESRGTEAAGESMSWLAGLIAVGRGEVDGRRPGLGGTSSLSRDDAQPAAIEHQPAL